MAGWTDYHADWSSVDALRLADDSVLSALVAAVSERRVASDTSAGFGGLPPAVGDLEERVVAWTYVIDALADVVGNYAKQTDSSGNWHDQADIPTWTTASIATAAGLGAWPTVPTELDELSATLVKSMYDIVNLLQWPLRDADDDDSDFNVDSADKDASHANWATAVSDFAAAAWSGWGAGDDARHEADESTGTYTISREKIRWPSGSGIRPTAIAAAQGIGYTLDLYVQQQISSVGDTYEDNDYSVTEDMLNRLYSGVGIDDGGWYDTEVTYGDFAANSMSQPGIGEDLSWRGDTGSASWLHYAVFKMNVVGGFEFQ